MVLIKRGQEDQLKLNPRVFIDILEDEDKLGRIVIELYLNKVSIVAEDIRCLFTGERGIGKQSGTTLNLKNSSISQIIKGMGIKIEINEEIIQLSEEEMIQRGYFQQLHDTPGLLSFSPKEASSINKSYLTLTLRPTPHLDNRNIVVGKIVFGMEILNKIESIKVNSKEEPLSHLFIQHCGELKLCLPDKCP
ncbi:cyclophilin-like protein [Neoconidiobolus thromboides FSU 785]|nr:cyclophilin-like protein [Neoconidiobolus thromboides FSU 785]